MVQLQQWQERTLLTDQGSPVPKAFRWIGIGGGAKPETQFVWPFPDTDWKGARIIIYSKNGLGTATISRQVNGLDVGTKLTLGAGDPPSVPTVFLDLTIVGITTGDLLGYEVTGSPTGTFADVNFTSYFEFADGLWGF